MNEQFRIAATEQVAAFRASNDPGAGGPLAGAPRRGARPGALTRAAAGAELVFPNTLNNTERKFVHFLCSQMGLTSKSHG